MGRGCWGASAFFTDFMKIGHLIYTSKTSGYCLCECRVSCSLSVFESRVLSVMLKRKGEINKRRNSKLYYDNCCNFYSSSSLGCSDGKGI